MLFYPYLRPAVLDFIAKPVENIMTVRNLPVYSRGGLLVAALAAAFFLAAPVGAALAVAEGNGPGPGHGHSDPGSPSVGSAPRNNCYVGYDPHSYVGYDPYSPTGMPACNAWPSQP